MISTNQAHEYLATIGMFDNGEGLDDSIVVRVLAQAVASGLATIDYDSDQGQVLLEVIAANWDGYKAWKAELGI